jgi:hypothetical protein
MNLAAIFVIICGAFVATVLILVVWLIITGLKDEAKRRIRLADDELNKP